jgi:UDP-N-acetylmuramate: L-alanyl-gamma-D-glutamyl-meso-diaminopimelate ligase
MANLAVQMKKLGYTVTGSDENVYPPMSTFLEKHNISVNPAFSEKNVAYNPDLIIVGNAVVRGNPEAEYVLDHKLNYMSFPEALKHLFLRDKQTIVVTGTHGKTTTASLLAWIFELSGYQPSFLIGGIPENFGFGFKLDKGNQFIIEGDEYDSAFFDKRSKFLHYLPEIVIINNIEFDHADIFRSLEDIKLSFSHLIKLIPRSGLLVVNNEDSHIKELIQNSFTSIETFGFKDANWIIQHVEYKKNGVTFRLNKKGQIIGDFFLPLLGNHNILNAVGGMIVLDHLGVSIEQIQKGFRSFKNVKRRLEIRGKIKDITVYDDFAHHPTAIRETLKGLHLQFPGDRIWAVFEPRTNTTRRNILQQEFVASFTDAFGVVIGKINRPHLLNQEERLDRETICNELANQNKICGFFDDVEEIVHWLVPQLKNTDKVVIMSNGGFDNIHEKLLERLR